MNVTVAGILDNFNELNKDLIFSYISKNENNRL